MPSRLLSAFPPGVSIRRIPLDAAIARVEEFLPGTGRGTVARSDMVEEAGRSVENTLRRHCVLPPPRAGED
jgi:hypothetical protein